MLSIIAEEMWKTASFKLKKDELDIVTQMALEEIDVSEEIKSDVLSKIYTHAALEANAELYQFSHEQFLWYYLGNRIARLIEKNNFKDLIQIMIDKELDPSAVEWFEYNIADKNIDIQEAVKELSKCCDISQGVMLTRNISVIIISIASLYRGNTDLFIDNVYFNEISTTKKKFYYCVFKNCRLIGTNLDEVTFEKCKFIECEFIQIVVTGKTNIIETTLDKCEIRSLDINGIQEYEPEEINKKLKGIGFIFSEKQFVKIIIVSKNIYVTVEKMVRHATRYHNCVLEDFEEEMDKYIVREVFKFGINNEIFKQFEKDSSGPKKTFFKIVCDKTDLLEGAFSASKNVNIINFWNSFNEKK